MGQDDLQQAETSLLQLCIGSPLVQAQGWERWVAALDAARQAGEVNYPHHWRDLLPLAAFRQREGSFRGPDWLISRLRTAAVLEDRRLTSVRAIAAEILATPAIAEHDPLMIGGLGIGETVYPSAAARHTGIITLLLRTGTPLRLLMYRLVGQGYRVREGGWRTIHLPLRSFARLRLAHPSAMKLLLLSEPVWRSAASLSHGRFRGRSQLVSAGTGLRFLAPGPADALALLERGIHGEDNASLVPKVDAALLRQALTRPSPQPTTPEVGHARPV